MGFKLELIIRLIVVSRLKFASTSLSLKILLLSQHWAFLNGSQMVVLCAVAELKAWVCLTE